MAARRETLEDMLVGCASRVVLVAVLVSGLTATLVGCTKTTYSCSNGRCEVSLSGDGATTEVDDNVEVVLVGADGESADLSVAGRSVRCTKATWSRSPGSASPATLSATPRSTSRCS